MTQFTIGNPRIQELERTHTVFNILEFLNSWIPDRHFSDSAALRGAAAVVWNRSDVPDRFHFDAGSLQSTYGRFTARSRPFDLDLYASHAHLLCRRGRFRSGLLRGKRSSLARSFEPHGAGAAMRNEISFQVRYADNGVVEGRQDVGYARRHVDLLPLLSRFLLH